MKNVFNFIAPNLETVGNQTFMNKKSIRYVYIPKVHTLGEECFQNCENVFCIVGDNISNIGKKCFQSSFNLHSINLEKVQHIPENAIYDTALTYLKSSCLSLDNCSVYENL